MFPIRFWFFLFFCFFVFLFFCFFVFLFFFCFFLFFGYGEDEGGVVVVDDRIIGVGGGGS